LDIFCMFLHDSYEYVSDLFEMLTELNTQDNTTSLLSFEIATNIPPDQSQAPSLT